MSPGYLFSPAFWWCGGDLYSTSWLSPISSFFQPPPEFDFPDRPVAKMYVSISQVMYLLPRRTAIVHDHLSRLESDACLPGVWPLNQVNPENPCSLSPVEELTSRRDSLPERCELFFCYPTNDVKIWRLSTRVPLLTPHTFIQKAKYAPRQKSTVFSQVFM